MTYVLLCADHDPPRISHGRTRYVPGLCSDPSLLSEVPDDVDHLVVGVHWADVDPSRLQFEMRRIGLDPLAVGTFDLTNLHTTDLVRATVAGMTVRTEAFPGATPEQIKLEPTYRLSRRSLLSGPAFISVGAPAIDHNRCLSTSGCRACVAACPADALTWQGGTIAYDKTVCINCGICVTTCPTGAVVNPTVTPEAIERQIRAIAQASELPTGVRFVCRNAEQAPPRPGYVDVSVACTGMLTPGWLLAPLLMGATAVDALPCSEGECKLGHDERLLRTFDDAMAILDAFGLDRGRLGGELDAPTRALDPESGSMFEPRVDARAVSLLAERGGVEQTVSISLRVTQVGFVAIDTITCTGCRMCAKICPTEALRAVELSDGISIDFDPRACVACGECLTICPEIEREAISLEVGFDLAEWEVGRREVLRDASPRCTRCGAPIAPSAMLDRIAEVLGADHEKALAVLTTVCVDCRGR